MATCKYLHLLIIILQTETTIPPDGYTQLARPFGRSVVIAKFQADNSWVVPHNKFLLCKYNAHINVECSASIEAVQYLYSYITKGNRPVVATVRHNDEIKAFSETRVTSSASAIWQTLKFPSHKQSPVVIRLGFRLPRDTSVLFNPDGTPEEIVEAANAAAAKPTELSAWFSLNRHDAFAATLPYVSLPTHYAFNDKDKCWVRRKRNAGPILGRLYPVDTSNREALALRLLLLEVKGCTCVDDIKKVVRDQCKMQMNVCARVIILSGWRYSIFYLCRGCIGSWYNG